MRVARKYRRGSGSYTEVVAVSIGEVACHETLRTAMALGADRALLVEANAEIEPLHVAT